MIRSSVSFAYALVMVLCALPYDTLGAQDHGTGSLCGAYRIVHINGIKTTQAEALLNADFLQQTYGTRFRASQLSYHLAYNPKGGLLPDLAQVLAQKQAEFPGATIIQMLRYLLAGVGGTLPSALVNQLATYWAGWVNGNGASYNSYSDTTLADLVETVRAHTLPDRRVLIVPHSQGNLYANRVVEIITSQAGHGWSGPVPEKSVGLVGVATPAAYVAGQRQSHKFYLTSSNDLIINGLRNGAPPLTGPQTVLPPNIDIALSADDPSGHGFRETYLGTDAGAAAVVGAMHAVLGALLSNARSRDEALALFDATYTIATPERPRMAGNGQWFTSPFVSYSDETLNGVTREGSAGLAETIALSLARSCVAREVTAAARGEAAQPPNPFDRLGTCNIQDEMGWRGYLPTVVRHDEIVLSVDLSSHAEGAYADVYVIGQCRNT
jgi:hypothetical protein